MIKIVKGKFYDENNNLVPPVVGDAEQIEAIKKAEKVLSDLKENGVVIHNRSLDCEPISYKTTAVFNCPCGKRVRFENESEDEDDWECLDGVEEGCWNCDTDYILEYKDDKLFVKIND